MTSALGRNFKGSEVQLLNEAKWHGFKSEVYAGKFRNMDVAVKRFQKFHGKRVDDEFLKKLEDLEHVNVIKIFRILENVDFR
jgi:hypothetical protein